MSRIIVPLVLGLFLSLSPVLAVDYAATLQEAKSLIKEGSFERAAELCNQVINARPGMPHEPTARLLMGYVLLKRGAPVSSTIGQFLDVVQKFPSSPDARDALLRIGYLKDKHKQEPSEWTRIVQEYPDTAEAAESLHCLGHIALRQGNAEEAIKRFELSAQAKNALPEMVEDSLLEAGYAYIGRFWQSQDRKLLVKALSHLLKVKKKPLKQDSLIRAHMGLGEIFLIQGLGEQAAREYQSVIKLNPPDAYTRSVAQLELACSLYTMEDWPSAVKEFDTFLASCQGVSLTDKDRNWKTARPGYAGLVAVDPAKATSLSGLELVPQAVTWKAAAMAKMGKYAEAKQLAEQVLNDFPGLTTAWRARSVRDECVIRLEEVK